jgi:hypothetical protein
MLYGIKKNYYSFEIESEKTQNSEFYEAIIYPYLNYLKSPRIISSTEWS